MHVDDRLLVLERDIGQRVPSGDQTGEMIGSVDFRAVRVLAVGIGDLQFEAVAPALDDVGDAGREDARVRRSAFRR
jgi:hypothetical protein